MGTIQTPDRTAEAVATVKTLADEREYTLRHLMNLVRMPIGNHEAVELAGIARAHGVSLAGLQQAADREAGLDFDTEADPRYRRQPHRLTFNGGTRTVEVETDPTAATNTLRRVLNELVEAHRETGGCTGHINPNIRRESNGGYRLSITCTLPDGTYQANLGRAVKAGMS